jgi:MFS-type transporter involved in bile tolerance (Atg22 family)
VAIRFAANVMAAISALIVFGMLAEPIRSATSFVGAVLLTMAVALGVMYGTEWLARVAHRRRQTA